MFETNPDIASFLQRAEHFGLGLDYDQRLPAYLEAVTMEQVRAAASEALNPDRAAVAIASPLESPIPNP
jgi:predicted Zn-dependent peptidase